MLSVDLTPLDEGVHELTFSPTADDIRIDPDVFNKIAVDLRLDVAEQRVLASFDVRAIATLECDRTLVMFEQPVQGDLSILFVPSEQLSPDSEDDSLQLLPETELDLTDAVRETLMLSLPLRRVAPDAEDAIIATTFGEREMLDGTPVDDRWDALRKLRHDNSD